MQMTEIRKHMDEANIIKAKRSVIKTFVFNGTEIIQPQKGCSIVWNGGGGKQEILTWHL